jgi:hypothetical protein
MNDSIPPLSIFVPTCSKYLALTQLLIPSIVTTLGPKHADIPFYISTDEPDHNGYAQVLDNVKLLHESASSIDWTTLTIRHLKSVPSDYVLLWLDDLVPTSHMNCSIGISEILCAMQLHNLDCLRLVSFFNKTCLRYGFEKYTERLSAFAFAGKSPIYRLPPDSPYSFSLLPAIWRRSTLLRILENNPGASPWQLEKHIQIPVNLSPSFAALSESAFGIQNLVIKGYLWPKSASKFYPLPVSILNHFQFLNGHRLALFTFNLLKHRLFLLFYYIPFLTGKTIPISVRPDVRER